MRSLRCTRKLTFSLTCHPKVDIIVRSLDCDDFSSEFGCRVVGSIVAWLLIFAQLSILGTLFVVCASLGNSVYAIRSYRSLVYVLLGLAALAISTVASYFYQREFFFADTRRNDDPVDQFLCGLVLFLGLLLMTLQLKVLLMIVVPETWYARAPFFKRFLVSGTAMKERRTKKASRCKVAAMVRDAMEMHVQKLQSTRSAARIMSHSVSYGNALLNFEATRNDREQVGGILWAFRKMWDGSIFEEEGVWLHARLIASNLSQVFVAVLFLILVPYILVEIARSDDSSSPPTVSPAPTRDPVAVAAEAIIPVVDYLLGLLAQAGDEVEEYVWSSTNASATADFTSAIIDAVANTTLADIVNSVDRSSLAALVSLGSEVLAGDESRMLESSPSRRLQEDTVEWLTPDTWNYIFAGIVAFIGTTPLFLSLAAVWLPSSVSTILQFRSGVIGSLRDKTFSRYRAARKWKRDDEQECDSIDHRANIF